MKIKAIIVILVLDANTGQYIPVVSAPTSGLASEAFDRWQVDKIADPTWDFSNIIETKVDYYESGE